MKYIRVVVNVIVILSAPLWAAFLVWFFIIQDIREGRNESLFNGRRYIWD